MHIRLDGHSYMSKIAGLQVTCSGVLEVQMNGVYCVCVLSSCAVVAVPEQRQIHPHFFKKRVCLLYNYVLSCNITTVS